MFSEFYGKLVPHAERGRTRSNPAGQNSCVINVRRVYCRKFVVKSQGLFLLSKNCVSFYTKLRALQEKR